MMAGGSSCRPSAPIPAGFLSGMLRLPDSMEIRRKFCSVTVVRSIVTPILKSPLHRNRANKMATVLCWFHQDLRLADHPALDAAIADGHAVIPLYILDDTAAGDWAMGGASRWWLQSQSGQPCRRSRKLGSRLVLAKGRAEEIIPQLMARTGAEAVYTHCRHEPWSKAQAARSKQRLRAGGSSRPLTGPC